MITMRDGVRLHTVILTLQTQTEPLPILLDRTPYGVNDWNSDLVNNVYKELVADRYIFVFQDIRGKFRSEGQFVMVRPPRDKRDPKSVDESTDTYDTIDWLVKNLPRNNDRVGNLCVFYRWLARHNGAHRPAPGSQGRVSASARRRLLDGRRLLSQRRVSHELRLRICEAR